MELLVAMTMSLVAAGAGLTMLGLVGQRNLDNRRHAERVTAAQDQLERMSRELRQANWVVFRSSAMVDADVPVRPSATGTAQRRLVRFDCTQGTSCLRIEGPATAFPPPASPTLGTPRVAMENLHPGSVVFVPQRVDPATGAVVRDPVKPTTIAISARVEVEGWERPVRLDDTVTLRNATIYASPS